MENIKPIGGIFNGSGRLKNWTDLEAKQSLTDNIFFLGYKLFMSSLDHGKEFS